MEQRGRKGGVRDSWDSLLMAINRLTVMTICDKSLGEESPKGFQPQPRQVWGFAKITQFWWPLKTGERWEMDQFLPSQRLKILPRGGGKNQPQITQQHGCPSSDEEGEKAHKGNFQQQQDTCANMSSLSLQCGGSASLGPDLSGSLGTNASLQSWNLRLHGWSKGDEYVLVSKKKETKGKHEFDRPTEGFGMFPFIPQTALTVVWILQTKNKKSWLSWSPSLTDVKMNNRWIHYY